MSMKLHIIFCLKLLLLLLLTKRCVDSLMSDGQFFAAHVGLIGS